MGLVLASIALQVCTGLTTPPSDFDAALGTKPGGPLSSKDVEIFLTPGFEAVARLAGKGLESVRLAERLWQAGAHRHGVQQVRPMKGFRHIRGQCNAGQIVLPSTASTPPRSSWTGFNGRYSGHESGPDKLTRS